MACVDKFHPIKVVALEEVPFLLLEKPRCPLVNQVGDDISTPMNHPFACNLRNLFGDGTSAHVYKPLDLDDWPNPEMGKTLSSLHGNYRFCKKKSGEWDKLLKAHC
jgi:hypothetical protein